MTTKAEVTEYTVARDEMLTSRRSGHGDAWAVRLRSSRLHRDALAWRAANPGAPIVAPTTCGAWDYEPMPTNRDDEWIASHTFALAEALAVCEAEAGATAERERDEARAALAAAARGEYPRCRYCPGIATWMVREGSAERYCDKCFDAPSQDGDLTAWHQPAYAAAIRAAMGAK